MTHDPELEGTHARTFEWLERTYNPDAIRHEVTLRTGKEVDFIVDRSVGKTLMIEVDNGFNPYDAGQAAFYAMHNPGNTMAVFVIPSEHAVQNPEEFGILRKVMNRLEGELVALDKDAKRRYK